MIFLTTKPIRGLAALLAAAALSACSAPDAAKGDAHQYGQASAGQMQGGGHMMHGQGGAGMTGGMSPGAATTEGKDMERMCAMYRDIRNAPPDQRQAMMDKHMQHMSPEMRQRHMDMMGQHCQ